MHVKEHENPISSACTSRSGPGSKMLSALAHRSASSPSSEDCEARRQISKGSLLVQLQQPSHFPSGEIARCFSSREISLRDSPQRQDLSDKDAAGAPASFLKREPVLFISRGQRRLAEQCGLPVPQLVVQFEPGQARLPVHLSTLL